MLPPKKNKKFNDIITILSIDKALENYIDSYQTCPLLATHLTDKTITYPPVPCLVKGNQEHCTTTINRRNKKNRNQYNQNNHNSKASIPIYLTCSFYIFSIELFIKGIIYPKPCKIKTSLTINQINQPS
jgi:hypothetical protein